MTEFTVSAQGANFKWEEYGFSFHVPEGSLPSGMEECKVNIRASFLKQFQLPEDTILLSPVFWISAPCISTKPVTLKIQHCAFRENERALSSLSFLSAKGPEMKPYRFKHLDGGEFQQHTPFGTIQLSHFCGICIAGRWNTPRSYCVHSYRTMKQMYDWRFYLAITLDHPTQNAVSS